MVAALELYFDSRAQSRVYTLWDALESVGVPSLRAVTHQRHRPHISLAVADSLDADAVAAALDGLPPAPPLRLSLSYVGQFAGGVLFLGPAASAELAAHHAEVIGRLDAAGVAVADMYRPGAWVPHCTLSMICRGEAISRAVPRCMDVLPLELTISGAAVADHGRGLYAPL